MSNQNRTAFTLTELLVVISLVAILAALAVLFLPNAASSAREARGAIALQGWLGVAKQRAMRDQRPYGLRLYTTSVVVSDATLNSVVTDCQYVEQPDDFGTARETAGTASRNSVAASGVPIGAPASYTNLNTIEIYFPVRPGFPVKKPVDLANGITPIAIAGGAPSGNPDPGGKFWFVQPGDYVELNGGGLVRRVAQVGAPGAGQTTSTGNTSYLVVEPAIAYDLPEASNFRIVRSPRPVGDEVLAMPRDVVVDLGTNATYGSQLPTVLNPLVQGTGYVDVVFAPTGAVISRGFAGKNVNLWVRCPNPENPQDVFRGDPTIVSVFCATGKVGAYAPDPTTPGSPYALVR